MGLGKNRSASGRFVLNNVLSYEELRQKFIYSFTRRIVRNKDCLVQRIYNCDVNEIPHLAIVYTALYSGIHVYLFLYVTYILYYVYL